ncbi:MAG: tRNA threonylcarbamoyladenosine dehydratase [Bacteroidetes bacterium]|nr:tRNA threonylcarbamoyladenosine dehydratase [Bacteroidota bacterium]MBS1685209.1 tRNA threonylcarbamoyladenosine dehydratase [Bacteroidota bacterium]
MSIPQWMTRTDLLLGQDAIKKLMDAHVLVVGLGGVGGICAEMIARSGVGRMTIVDADVVEASNRNRQVPALVSTDGQSKAMVLGERLLDINPDLDLTIINEFINPTNTPELLKSTKFDYVADCIDTLTSKANLIKQCYEYGIPVASSMGAGSKVDPTQVKISDIAVTYNCKLAYHVRKRLHRSGIRRGIKVVWSAERPSEKRMIVTEGGPKKSIVGTISYMPAVFGCAMASIVVRSIYE